MLRTMLRLVCALAVVASVSMACGGEPEAPENPANETLIRVRNGSPYTFNSVRVNTADFGDMGANGLSTYELVEAAWNNEYVQLFINGLEFLRQPIDHVGEQPLASGRYTYTISIPDFDSRFPVLNVERDGQ